MLYEKKLASLGRLSLSDGGGGHDSAYESENGGDRLNAAARSDHAPTDHSNSLSVNHKHSVSDSNAFIDNSGYISNGNPRINDQLLSPFVRPNYRSETFPVDYAGPHDRRQSSRSGNKKSSSYKSGGGGSGLRRTASFRTLRKWVNRLRPPIKDESLGTAGNRDHISVYRNQQPCENGTVAHDGHNMSMHNIRTHPRDLVDVESRLGGGQEIGTGSQQHPAHRWSHHVGSDLMVDQNKNLIEFDDKFISNNLINGKVAELPPKGAVMGHHQQQSVSRLLLGPQPGGRDSSPAITGLTNRGNTCYMNAVVQCLAVVDPLAEYFVTDRFLLDLNPSSRKAKHFGSEGQVTSELGELLRRMWLDGLKYINPKHLVDTIEYWSRKTDGVGFKTGQQHDAQEFYVWLLDKVHEDLNLATKKKIKPLKQKRDVSEDQLAVRQTEQDLQCNRSFVRHLFAGQFRSTILCPFCSYSRMPFEPFTCVSLSMPQQSTKPVFVVMVYYRRRPRLLCLGLNADVSATFGEIKQCLQQEAKVDYEQLVLCNIPHASAFERSFRDPQSITSLGDVSVIFGIELPPFGISPGSNGSSANEENIPVICLNVFAVGDSTERFGNPICVNILRETSYPDLCRALLAEFKPQLRFDLDIKNIPLDSFRVRVADGFSPDPYLTSDLPMPLYAESAERAITVHGAEFGPAHLKLVFEWNAWCKEKFFNPVEEEIFDHISACDLRDEIADPPCPTLSDCLNMYTQPEHINMDGWRCPNCKSNPKSVEKRILFRHLPNILVFQLKRFKQVSAHQNIKLDPLIKFPITGLDLSPHLYAAQTPALPHRSKTDSWIKRSPRNRRELQAETNSLMTELHGPPIYDLIAVCNHHGESLNSGHYTAYCRNPVDGAWRCFDDEKVSSIDEGRVVSKDAYLLFYERRCGSRPKNCRSSSESGFAEHWVFQPHPVIHSPHSTTPYASRETLHFSDTDHVELVGGASAFPRGSRSYATIATSSHGAGTKNSSFGRSAAAVPTEQAGPSLRSGRLLSTSDDGRSHIKDMTTNVKTRSGIFERASVRSSQHGHKLSQPIQQRTISYTKRQPGMHGSRRSLGELESMVAAGALSEQSRDASGTGRLSESRGGVGTGSTLSLSSTNLRMSAAELNHQLAGQDLANLVVKTAFDTDFGRNRSESSMTSQVMDDNLNSVRNSALVEHSVGPNYKDNTQGRSNKPEPTLGGLSSDLLRKMSSDRPIAAGTDRKMSDSIVSYGTKLRTRSTKVTDI